MYASYTFDVSVCEIWATLLQGGILHILNQFLRLNPEVLSNYFIKNDITYIFVPPAILSILPKDKKYCLKGLIIAGETCSTETGIYWSKHVNLYNYHGPTEATIYACGRKVTDNNISCIGEGINNTRLYILDKDLKPVPIGVEGELHIGGVGLAHGYLNLPDLTQEKFIPNPFATEKDKQLGYTRLYKTGDLCKWLDNGEIEYIGRNDFQVKIRGFRIELGEIESVISEINNIQQVCVITKQKIVSGQEQTILVAYYISPQGVNETDIKKYLSKKLLEYMIPNSFIKLDKFPLTINGKLDRRSLPEPQFSSKEYIAPISGIQKQICNIWQDLLKVDKVGITDNFFELGGNSILAIQVAYKMSDKLNNDIAVADIFRFKTIQEILENSKVNQIQLIKPYSNISSNKPLMIFVHPAFSGCEVYQVIAEKLSNYYNCVGIDNYNIYSEDKIDDLAKLAKYYLNCLDLSDKNSEIYFFGWSLGGLIALEMSYWLEIRGFKKIKAVVLDSHFSKGRILRYHPQFNPRKGGEYVDAIIAKQISRLDEAHKVKVLAAKVTENKLGQTKLSGYLKHTKVVLFKAMQNVGYNIPDNNLRKYCKNMGIIPINVNHMQLIKNILDNWDIYNDYFRVFDFNSLYQKPKESLLRRVLRIAGNHKKKLGTALIGTVIYIGYVFDVFDVFDFIIVLLLDFIAI